MWRSRSQRGFTLIEVVLAMALTAMLLTLLSGGMYSVVRDWDNDTDILDTQLNETVALLQVERALQGAFPHSYLDTESLGRFIFFPGEDASLAWVSAVSPQRRGGLTAWWLENDDEGVLLRLAPAMSDNPTARLESTEPVLLLENYAATFSYLYEEADGSKRWRDDWPGDQLGALPLAVHILFSPVDADAARTRPLEVVARIRANEHRTIRPAFAVQSDTGVGGFGSSRQAGPRSGGSR